MDEKSWWDYWNTSYRTEDGIDEISTELFERAAAVVNSITAGRSARILEIGCGTGSFSRLLLHYSAYHGIDISPAAIELARHKSVRLPGGSQPSYEAADFHDWAAPPEAFDIVICIDAVAYFRDQQLALSKMAASLRPSGTVVLTTINPFVYNRIRRTSSRPLQEGSVSRWLSRSELHSLIHSAPLALERSLTIMPRGNRGILRLINSPRLNRAFCHSFANTLKRHKESVGLGQYRLVVAHKSARA